MFYQEVLVQSSTFLMTTDDRFGSVAKACYSVSVSPLTECMCCSGWFMFESPTKPHISKALLKIPLLGIEDTFYVVKATMKMMRNMRPGPYYP